MRDVVADNPNTFEIHKVEHLKDKPENLNKSGGENTSAIIMRLECEDQHQKDEWVRAINSQVKNWRSKDERQRLKVWII